MIQIVRATMVRIQMTTKDRDTPIGRRLYGQDVQERRVATRGCVHSVCARISWVRIEFGFADVWRSINLCFLVADGSDQTRYGESISVQ